VIQSVYVIGSLRNELVPVMANRLRDEGFDAFDAWYSAGPEADDCWKAHSQLRGQTYREALADHAAQHVFEFDKLHLDRCDAAVLVLPAGKSGHLELGYMVGRGKPGYILLDSQEDRWDVMLQFATSVCDDFDDLIRKLHDA
jgi:nucleoside 2-deoxyribosyltransferase